VRLVAAPELQVAAFGGDADNYTYPRWNLDFSLFRVYEHDRPYRPEAFLPFTGQALRAGDLTLISGHPGTTSRQETHAQMRYAKEALLKIPNSRKAMTGKVASGIGISKEHLHGFMIPGQHVQALDLAVGRGGGGSGQGRRQQVPDRRFQDASLPPCSRSTTARFSS
jgi:hypothetical protein